MHDRLERIESIKAGSLGGIAVGIGYGAIESSQRLLLPATSSSVLNLGLAAAIAVTSGFLFGVTYRYIIRTDRNDHLNSGAVLAFGLIRGLAQVDVDRFQLAQIGIDAFIVGKSILLLRSPVTRSILHCRQVGFYHLRDRVNPHQRISAPMQIYT